MTTTPYFLCFVCAVIQLAPAFLYLFSIQKDPFHPTIFVGTLAFMVTAGGVFISVEQLERYLDVTHVNYFLLVSGASVLAFYLGWFLHNRRDAKRVGMQLQDHAGPREYNPLTLFFWAWVCILIGVPVALMTRTDNAITGYVRDFGSLWVAGSILSIQVALLSSHLRMGAMFTLAISLIPPLDHFYSYGQRGDTFRIAVVVMIFFLFRNKRPARVIFIPLAVGLALVLATLERTRTLVGEGSSMTRVEALSQVIPTLFDSNKKSSLDTAETYVFGPATIRTVRETGTFEYGAYIYNLGVRFLPKEYFDKANLYTRWYPTTAYKFTSQNAGFAIPPGSAPSGFAHVFVEFGWGALIFWAILGYWARICYLKATRSNDLRYQAYLTALFIVYLYLITQDLYASTMNAIYLFPALAIAYRYARVRQVALAEPMTLASI